MLIMSKRFLSELTRIYPYTIIHIFDSLINIPYPCHSLRFFVFSRLSVWLLCSFFRLLIGALRSLAPNPIRVQNIVHQVGCHPTKGHEANFTLIKFFSPNNFTLSAYLASKHIGDSACFGSKNLRDSAVLYGCVLSISKYNLACNFVKVFEEAKFRCVKVQFSLGLLFNFFWMFIIFCGETRLKLVCLGMYRRMSLLVFSTHPFCHEEYASAKQTITSSLPFICNPLVINVSSI